MIKNKFINSIKRGTGEAILILKDNPNLEVNDFLIKASIKNMAYDPQCEGSRENYIFELIQLSPQKDKIEMELLEKLIDAKDDDYWGTTQLFDLVKLFAQNGNNNARKSIYKRYSKNLISKYEFINTFVPIELDAFEGFRFIAEIKGQRLIENENAWEDDYIIQYAKEIYPEIDFEKKLAIEAKKSKFIGAFLKEIKRSRKQNKSCKIRKHTSKSIIELIENNNTVPFYVGKKLNEKDLIKLADRLNQEKDEEKLLKYLRIFSQVKFPLEFNTLFKFLGSNNKKIIFRTLDCLKFFKDPQLRNLALNKLNNKEFEDDYFELLIENYNNDDYRLITKILKSIRSKDTFHSLGSTVLKIYENNKTKECYKPLKIIYDKGFCGLCRENAITIMIENKVLPEYIKIEGIFDSNIEIREKIKKLQLT